MKTLPKDEDPEFANGEAEAETAKGSQIFAPLDPIYRRIIK